MANFTVKFTKAGPFKRGEVITDKQIKDAGFDVDHWLGHGAIEKGGSKKSAASEDADTGGDTGDNAGGDNTGG